MVSIGVLHPFLILQHKSGGCRRSLIGRIVHSTRTWQRLGKVLGFALTLGLVEDKGRKKRAIALAAGMWATRRIKGAIAQKSDSEFGNFPEVQR